VTFFEPPPLPEPIVPEVIEVPEWAGPPHGVLGGVVPLGLLLARSERAAVAIESTTVYPTGIEFVIDVRWREPSVEWLWPQGFDRRRRGGGLPDELFRFGVQFSDGTKATSLGSGLDVPLAVAYGAPSAPATVVDAAAERVPRGPLLTARGGSGGGLRYSQTFWLWPLPPEGPLSFVCEWPALDIELTRVEVDSAPLREAAARGRPLWDDEAGAARSGAAPAP
jgi:hypothetical protein